MTHKAAVRSARVHVSSEEMEMGLLLDDGGRSETPANGSERSSGDTDSSQEWTRHKPLPLNMPEEEAQDEWLP